MHTGGSWDCFPTACPSSEFVAGFHASLNVNQYLAFVSRFDIAPNNSPYESTFGSGSPMPVRQGGHVSEFLLGARGSVRGKRWGLFADAQPGVLSWSHAALDLSALTSPDGPGNINFGRRNSFALDLGGGVNYSPRPRLRVSMGLGDVLVDSNETNILFDSIDGTRLGSTAHSWQNQLEAKAGATWAFGKPIIWTPPDIHQAPGHRFFDKINLTLLTISLLGQLSDGITTQRFIKRGNPEGDPLYKPLVEQGWPGQIGAGVIDNAAQISIMYALHRMNHHRIERIVPLFRGAIGGIEGYRNDRTE